MFYFHRKIIFILCLKLFLFSFSSVSLYLVSDDLSVDESFEASNKHSTCLILESNTSDQIYESLRNNLEMAYTNLEMPKSLPDGKVCAGVKHIVTKILVFSASAYAFSWMCNINFEEAIMFTPFICNGLNILKDFPKFMRNEKDIHQTIFNEVIPKRLCFPIFGFACLYRVAFQETASLEVLLGITNCVQLVLEGIHISSGYLETHKNNLLIKHNLTFLKIVDKKNHISLNIKLREVLNKNCLVIGFECENINDSKALVALRPKWDETKCSICFDDFKENQVIAELLPCRHIWHQECIKSWFKNNNTCPFCKQISQFLVAISLAP